MVSPWPSKPFTFRALAKTYGQMWLRCDVCRRYAGLKLAGLQDVDYRTKTFSCSRCGNEAFVCVIEPVRETGRQDYPLDQVERPVRHPDAVRRLTSVRGRIRVDKSGGELPRRKVRSR